MWNMLRRNRQHRSIRQFSLFIGMFTYIPSTMRDASPDNEANGMRCPMCRVCVQNDEKIRIYRYLTEVEPKKAIWWNNLGISQLRNENQTKESQQEGFRYLIRSVELDQSSSINWQNLANSWPDDKGEVPLRLASKGEQIKAFEITRLQAYGMALDIDPTNEVAMKWINYLLGKEQA